MSPRFNNQFLNQSLILLLFFIFACSHLPLQEEIIAEQPSVLFLEDVDLDRPLKSRGENSSFLESTLITEGFHSFISNGLEVSILMPNRLGNSGFIRVENFDCVFPTGTKVITMRIKFGLLVEDFFKTFQVVGGIDPISRSVEYQDSTLLNEFFFEKYVDVNALRDFSFGIYFEIDRERVKMNPSTLIEKIDIQLPGIELTILDDSMLLEEEEECLLTPNFERDKRIRILEMMKSYLAGAKASALETFSFDMYFELESLFVPLNIVNQIKEIRFCPTGIELTILDDSMMFLSVEEIREIH